MSAPGERFFPPLTDDTRSALRWGGGALLVAAVIGYVLSQTGPKTPQVVSLPWAVISTTSPTKIELAVDSGGCTRFTRLHVRATSAQVAVTALGEDDSAGGLCTLDIHFQRTILRLTAPLDGRQLVHGQRSPGWDLPAEQRAVRSSASFLRDHPGAG